ncbi:MAG: isochorismatase family cysteine hydrolase, partial [Nanoarchaeota archaeon]
MTDTALILVDFQVEYTTKLSDYYIGNPDKLIERVNKLLEWARGKSYKIIFIQHVEKSGEEFTGKNAEIWSKLDKNGLDPIIKKHHISSFYQTNLEKELMGIKHLLVCGLLTNLCVRMLVEEAYDREFEITIVPDCCAALTEDVHDFTLEDLRITREKIKLVN